MSCLMMNAAPLAAVADFLAVQLNSGFDYTGMETPQSLPRALSDCVVCGFYEASKIYEKLYRLNAAAYANRYREPLNISPPAPYRSNPIHKPCAYKNQHRVVAPWHYHIAKQLSFLIYQCTEDGTCETVLYSALVQFRRILHSFIVENSELWQQLPWAE